MMRTARHTALGALMLTVAGGLMGCEEQQGEDVTRAEMPFTPKYLGVETQLLDNDLVTFKVRMTGARDNLDVAAYGECAASQYALIRGWGFARHVRTKVDETSGGVWEGDATYVISDALPEGLKTIDAEVSVSACNENGIPTI
ncbi:MAG: hypothetical protein ACRBCL_09430 [Maritimibacter sp.]